MALRHRIAPGLDADVAIVDLHAEWVLDRTQVQSSAGYSPYEGERVRGRVVHSCVRERFKLRDDGLLSAALTLAAVAVAT